MGAESFPGTEQELGGQEHLSGENLIAPDDGGYVEQYESPGTIETREGEDVTLSATGTKWDGPSRERKD